MVVEMNEKSSERMLFDACKKFIEEIDKFESSLVYESDFRYAIYVELVKIMDEKGMISYPIITEYEYGHSKPRAIADFSLGKNHEVAVEFKFTIANHAPSPTDALLKGKQQLKRYLKNGAKKAYLVYLDWPEDDHDLASTIINLEDFGLSGEWKRISTKKYCGDLLIATVV